MADPFDIRTLDFPTLAEPETTDILTAVDTLRRLARGDRDPSLKNFTAEQREKFQREGLTGENRMDRVLATLDAMVQQNPAAAFAAMLPAGGITGLGALREAQLQGGPGNVLARLAEVAGRSSDPAERIRDLIRRNPSIFKGMVSGKEESGRGRSGRELKREPKTGRVAGPV